MARRKLETDKVKIAIPETVGQGLTFSYGGSYSYAGGYTGSYGAVLAGMGEAAYQGEIPPPSRGCRRNLTRRRRR